MKIGTKLIISFLVVAGFISILGVASIYQLSLIAEPLSKDIPEKINELSVTTQLDNHAQQIRYYDEVLTQSARNFAFTGDKQWEERYYEFEPLLSEAINNAVLRGDSMDAKFFESVSYANDELISMESDAISLVNQGDNAAAILILESDEYQMHKQEYANGLNFYVERRALERDYALSESTNTLHDATFNIRESVNFGITVEATLIMLVIGGAIGFGYFVSRSITKPLVKLQNAAKLVTSGNLDSKIEPTGDDENKELARSFNEMTTSLQKTIDLEKKLTSAESKLKNERLTAIGELSSRIAHDLRNPLTVIKTELELIQYQNVDNLDQKTQKRMSNISHSLKIMENQINDIMDFVRVQELEIVTTSTFSVTESLVTQIQKPENVTLIFPKKDFSFQCDINKMLVVLTNMITNALQAIGKDKGTIELQFNENDDDVVIKIIDSGPGIPEHNIEKIFEPLFTTKTKGTGLGLSSCKNIIKQHGGKITVSNYPTTFIITLPKERPNSSFIKREKISNKTEEINKKI